MNKAFTKESDDAEEPELEVSSVPSSVKNYLTPRGYARLREELIALLEVERPEVVRTVSWAASNGDRSENGDYIYGKKRLREIDRRIRFLTQRLDVAEIVDPAAQQNVDRVYFGATVTYRDEQGTVGTVTIVGVDESEPLLGRISWVAPLAKALLRAQVGDVVSFVTPEGEQQLELLAIRYDAAAPEAAA